MRHELYKKLCELLYQGDGDDYAFSHVFLTLECNRLTQRDNCLAMNVNHVQWDNDSLVFYFSKMKGDQSGGKSYDPWHLYSNPKNPELYPVLALTKYLLSHPDLMNGNSPLFPGNNQYNRFIKTFHKVIQEKKETFHILCAEEHSLGSHSYQKRAISLCLSRCMVCPPMASI